MASNSDKTELAIIGGGPGGYAAAFLASDLGLEVTLVDPEENPGGVCLYRGCIPSKALLHVARLLQEAEKAKEWGVSFSKPKVNINKLRSWKDDVVARLTGGVGQLSKQHKINHIRGTAKFRDNRTLDVTAGKKTSKLKFEHAILATGSYPAVIPNLAPDSKQVLDSTTALDLKDVPKSLLVIGGGYIGLELGSVFATLGSKVTVVEMTPGLLPGVDRDLVGVLSKRLEELFQDILLKTKVTEMKARKNGIEATLEQADGATSRKRFEKVLVAVGRKPNSEGIGLENTKVRLDARGFVKVNEQRRTSEPTIFAIGDVAGEPMLAHKATHEGRVAAEVIAGKRVAYEPQAVPAVVFTDPEIAWCGLTETQAKADSRDIEIAKFPWAASGRALTLGRRDGLTKLIFEPKSERLLGMGVTGPGAGELIAEGVLAVEMGAVASDISLSIHPHPTLSETVMESADVLHGQSTHYYRRRRRQ
jgi:dihydrolipoamide dehydrogenase